MAGIKQLISQTMIFYEKEQEMKKNLEIYWKLFLSMLSISAFTFGGGFVIISLMKKKYVENLKWIEDDEMLDLAAIAQSSPGALGVNAAVIVGYKVKKIPGAVVSTIATIIPPLVIISVISFFYAQFRDNRIIQIALQVMRAGVAAVIFDVVFNLAKNVLSTKSILFISMMFLTFIASYFFKVSAITIILICAFIGLLTVLIGNKKGEK